ncbi:hypothetical protein Taro_056041 [Colocasia esculenta]|uniref:Bifunctional inhibitor/plant lipid transfer protein/seed storage helical domain-containing protein n=1 Tax=Colocasia esculenta TaxID=4460 RepID=A0A843XVB6_COLES|nr:hypothetical protein [Colocasia esculenta]
MALLLLLCSRPTVAISCGDAVSAVAPCGGYLVGVGEANPTPQCCQSVQSLSREASTPPARKELCECFKETGPSFGVRPDRVRSMLAFCKLQLNLPISPNVDCDQYCLKERYCSQK